jgi:hypothetical protein
MRFRKLRIAWSVGCGIACVLLICLWVRSYWWLDIITKNSPGFGWFTETGSCEGRIDFFLCEPKRETSFSTWSVLSVSEIKENEALIAKNGGEEITPGQRWYFNFRLVGGGYWGFEADTPHAVLVLASATLAGIPWIRRFSLRTLLIATTLVAVVLGVGVYAVRK